jgi:hypothetical protein
MTKLVIVLAVVVVVILVVVFVAVRNMRAEDPDEFADRPSGRGGSRGSRDDRDPRYDRREPAEPQPARASRGSRPAGRPATNGHRPAAGAARGSGDRRDRRDDGYDEPGQNGRGYDERRRGSKDTQRRLEQSHASARSRQARGRRSDDSSEWDSSDWEKLSDVDYWTELAADKPLTTTAQPAAQVGPGRPRADREVEREVETAAMPAPLPAAAGSVQTVPGGAPRRDPATGLPVRGRLQPDDAELLAATDGRGDFAAVPILPAAAEDQFRPPARQADFGPGPVSAAAAEGQLRPLAEPRLSRHGGSAGFPGPVRGVSADRPPVDPDDDPLTSPSFPRVPAADSRSYHSGRASTPPRGTRVPEGPLAPTQQFTSYGSPVSQRAAARHAGPADVGGDADRTSPNSYLPDPLLNGDPYPALNGDRYPAPNGDRYPARNGERYPVLKGDPYPVLNGDPYPAPNGDPYPGQSAPAPAAPAPAAPAPAAPPASASPRTSGPTTPASGNPYGSYVTSDSQDTAFGYGGYPSVPGNGHGSYLPSPVPGGSTGRHAGNGHRPRQQPESPADAPAPGASGYPAHRRDPRHASAPAADYRNGYGPHDQAGYPPGGYPAGSPNPAGYGLPDPYRRDGYNGYPEYGTTEN